MCSSLIPRGCTTHSSLCLSGNIFYDIAFVFDGSATIDNQCNFQGVPSAAIPGGCLDDRTGEDAEDCVVREYNKCPCVAPCDTPYGYGIDKVTTVSRVSWPLSSWHRLRPNSMAVYHASVGHVTICGNLRV